MVRRLFFSLFAAVAILTACTDNDSFSSSAGNLLTFSEDTVRFDTLFSTVPSSTRTFWVHNESSDGIRIVTARLERSNQSGYRVNVNGTYLDPVGSDFEVRKGDSLLVFVEITTRENHADEPQLVEDNLVFTLESGAQQRVNLRTYSWDAIQLDSLVVRQDTVIETSQPVVVYGNGIRVEENATLTIRNTTLYFHDGAGITAYGNVVAENSLFRGDRLDRMFEYLPYDRISGQWRGIELHSHSGDNRFSNCEIRNAVDALMCDSTSLYMFNTIVHNASGEGLSARHSDVYVEYCQFSNTYGDCLSFYGCEAIVEHSTLAQFYPFSANRGAALRFANTELPMLLDCRWTLATGYADDVVMGEVVAEADSLFDYRFSDCLLRTPAVEDSLRFERVIWETPKDSVQGKEHFVLVDEENLIYDFALDSISPALQHGIGRIPIPAEPDVNAVGRRAAPVGRRAVPVGRRAFPAGWVQRRHIKR